MFILKAFTSGSDMVFVMESRRDKFIGGFYDRHELQHIKDNEVKETCHLEIWSY
jgi:hypothetical protein